MEQDQFLESVETVTNFTGHRFNEVPRDKLREIYQKVYQEAYEHGYREAVEGYYPKEFSTRAVEKP